MLKQLEELSAALLEQRQDNERARRRAKTSMRPKLSLNRSESQERADQPLSEIVLSDLRKRRQRGESYSALAADLNQRGLRGPNGARWYTSSVRMLLQC
jgi:hypothetical protein